MATESLGRAVLTLAVDDRDFRSGLRTAEQTAQQTVGSVNNLLSVIGLGLSFGAVIAGIRSLITAASELETITRKLANTLGDKGATEALSFTNKLAGELGLNFKTLAGSFSRFTAAATSAGVPIEQQRDLFAAVSKAAQSLGLSNDELNGSFLALQQVASKGNVQMEELRGQLGERLPIALSATAKGLGVTQQQLIKLVETGRLSANQFFPALTKGLNEITAASGGTLTTAQNLEKLATAFDQLQTSAGQNLLPGFAAIVVQLSQAIEGLGVQVRARDLRESFGVSASNAEQLVGTLRALEGQFSLTSQQAKNLLSDSLKAAGVNRDLFGEAAISGQQFGKIQLDLIERARQFVERNRDVTAELKRQEILANRLAKATTDRDKLKELIGLTPTQRKDVESRQKLESEIKPLVQAYQSAANAYLRANTETAKVLRTELEAAFLKITALLEKTIQEAAIRRRGAQIGLAGTIAGNFDIASDQQRQFARDIFQRQINEAIAKNAVSPERLAAKFGFGFSPAGSLNVNGIQRSFALGVDTTNAPLEKLAEAAAASQSMVDASQNLADALKNYNDTVTSLEKQTGRLVEKNWDVYVYVPGGNFMYGGDAYGANNRFQGS